MGKAKKSEKKREKKKNKKQVQPAEPPKIPPTPRARNENEVSRKSWWNHPRNIVLLTTGLLLCALVPLLQTCYNDYFKSEQAKADENSFSGKIEFPPISNNEVKSQESVNYAQRLKTSLPQGDSIRPIKGIHIPELPTLDPKKGLVQFEFGTNILGCSPEQLYNGVDVFAGFSFCNGYPLIAIAKDDRVYVSSKFIDLRTPTEIGSMEFNYWKVYNGKGHLREDDDRLEVKDLEGNVVFSIAAKKNSSNPVIMISGYWNGANDVFLTSFRDSTKPGSFRYGTFFKCIQKSEKHWLDTALTYAEKIASVYD